MAQGTKAAAVLGKVEGRNPAYSVKCRIGAAHDLGCRKEGLAETGRGNHRAYQRQHRHSPGLCGSSPGYKLTLTMPETMSIERRKVLAAFGANSF